MRRTRTTSPAVGTRVTLAAGLVLLAVLLPWWATTIAAIALLFRYDAYEIVLAGLMIDSLYGGPGAMLFGVQFFATAVFALAALVAPLAKRGIIFYS